MTRSGSHEPVVPDWLAQRLRAAGGAVPFLTYMAWVLHDPDHGAYATGRLRIGPAGDFVTSPSLGPEFAALLAPQLADWLLQLEGPVALVEAGPGEGQLALQLAEALAAGWPELRRRCELVLVEPSAGLAERQRRLLADAPLPVSWASFAELAAAPRRGVVLAHEVLDALAVERIVWDGERWCRQDVQLHDAPHEGLSLHLVAGPPLDAERQLPAPLQAHLAPADRRFSDGRRPAGWCTELHPGLAPWLSACAAALSEGQLLVIDYAHEAHRYYAPQRSNGTLMAYRAQQATDDPLRDPGHWDLTAHLCLESLEQAAIAGGWRVIGCRRQGEALLALGLAQRLHGLQHAAGAGDPGSLPELLRRRESLLRLVDPAALGDFRWIALARSAAPAATPAAPPAAAEPAPLFLQDPPLL